MAFLYITEFGVALDDRGGVVDDMAQPPLAEQKIAIGGASAPSAAFNAGTRLVRLHTDAICSVKVGAATPVATVANMRMAANESVEFRVVPGSGLMVANIANT